MGINDEILYYWFIFFSIFNFVILRVLGAFVVQILFLTALFGIMVSRGSKVSDVNLSSRTSLLKKIGELYSSSPFMSYTSTILETLLYKN